MTDVRNWDRDANGNNLPPPDGAPEQQTTGSVNDCIRENMAAGKRLDDDHNGSLSSTGTGGAYAVTSAQNDLTAYYAGQVIAFIANHANTGAATINVNGIGARALTKPYGIACSGGEIAVGQIVMAVYEVANTRFQLISVPGPAALIAESAGTLGNEQIMIDWSSTEGRIRTKNTVGAPASSLSLATTTSAGATNDAISIDSLQIVSVSEPSAPQARLDVAQNGLARPYVLRASSDDGSVYILFAQNKAFSTTQNEGYGVFISNTGTMSTDFRGANAQADFRIGSVSPVIAMSLLNDAGVQMPQVYNDIVSTALRDVQIDSAGRLGYQSSSERYKENVQPLASAAFVHALRPVRYSRKDSGQEETGLIAEEVFEVAPDYVYLDEEQRPNGIDYKGLVVPVIRELQQLREDFEQLKATKGDQAHEPAKQHRHAH